MAAECWVGFEDRRRVTAGLDAAGGLGLASPRSSQGA